MLWWGEPVLLDSNNQKVVPCAWKNPFPSMHMCNFSNFLLMTFQIYNIRKGLPHLMCTCYYANCVRENNYAKVMQTRKVNLLSF
jgi:hypothetical protein